MSERLTWNKIVEQYPDQWVGLVEIEYKDGDTTNINSAVVFASGDSKINVEEKCWFEYDGDSLCMHTNPASLPLINVANW